MRPPKNFDFDLAHKPDIGPARPGTATRLPPDGVANNGGNDQTNDNTVHHVGRADGKGNGASQPPTEVAAVPPDIPTRK